MLWQADARADKTIHRLYSAHMFYPYVDNWTSCQNKRKTFETDFDIKTSGFIRFTQRNSLPKIPSSMVAVHIWPYYMQSGLPVQTWVEKWEYFALKKINSLDILVRRNHNCQNKTPLQLQWPITGMLLKIFCALFLRLG